MRLPIDKKASLNKKATPGSTQKGQGNDVMLQFRGRSSN